MVCIIFGEVLDSKDDADHILTALRSHYKISVDYKGMHYCDFTIDWNYKKGNTKQLPSLNILHIFGSSQPTAITFKWKQLTNLKK